MQFRKAGFTQAKPKTPGVYFISAKLSPLNRQAPSRNAEGWDVAYLYFWAGSYDNVHENLESAAHWRIKALDGLEYSWQPGMWTKGPIRPDSELSNGKLRLSQRAAVS